MSTAEQVMSQPVRPYRQEMGPEDRAALQAAFGQWRAILAGRRALRARAVEALQRAIDAGYTQAAIARALGTTRQEIGRLLREGEGAEDDG